MCDHCGKQAMLRGASYIYHPAARRKDTVLSGARLNHSAIECGTVTGYSTCYYTAVCRCRGWPSLIVSGACCLSWQIHAREDSQRVDVPKSATIIPKVAM